MGDFFISDDIDSCMNRKDNQSDGEEEKIKEV
jgi:hypothetical protein